MSAADKHSVGLGGRRDFDPIFQICGKAEKKSHGLGKAESTRDLFYSY